VYFNYLFNSKQWFIKYKDIDLLLIKASNSGTSAVIRKGTVQVPLLLLNRSVNIIKMLNAMYQLATLCNLVSAGQLEHNIVV
jgi:hypothetical protein